MLWKLLPVISAPMSFQMALDETLFQKVKDDLSHPSFFRFYHSSGPWITAGCSFRFREELERSELVKAHPRIPIARRITGGGCVLHGEDLIFSLITPCGDRVSETGAGSLEGGVKESYRKIHACVIAAFRKLGFDPGFYEETEALPKGDDCFSFPVASDLSWKGRKIAGGAQKRSGGILLHHESIKILRGISSAALIKAVRSGFTEVLGVSFAEANLDPGVFFEAEQCLKDQRLSTND